MSSTNLKMSYQNLGRSGLKVSKVILGAMSYGDPKWQEWVLPEDKALPLLEHAYKVGIRTWDTADIYSHGCSEQIIGKALRQYNIPREKVVILTKCFFGITPEEISTSAPDASINDGELLNQAGLSRKHIVDAVEKSVARLGTYIDVLQIHRLDHSTPREEIMRALNDVVESGKVRYIGASSMAAWEFQTLQNIAEKNRWHKFISMQNYYNLVYREEEHEMIPYCHDTGIGLTPWSPIAQGILARPWTDRTTLREQSATYIKSAIRSREDESDAEIVGRVEQVAKKIGKSMAQVAMAWCLSKKDVCPIVGLSSIGRIDEACEACDMKLSEGDLKFLEEAYIPKKRLAY